MGLKFQFPMPPGYTALSFETIESKLGTSLKGTRLKNLQVIDDYVVIELADDVTLNASETANVISALNTLSSATQV